MPYQLNMPHLKYIFLLITITPLLAFSQVSEKAARHNSKIKEHSLRIKYGESRTHREHVKNSEEIGKHLDSAVIEHERLKKNVPKKYRDDVERNTAMVERQHLEARRHHNALKNELNKEKHNEMAVRHHANRIHASVEKAEKEEGIIKAKTER
ncbi:MAG: hypothetical protein H7329_10255 [Opitutaceae bacterium]|nr:hypothetical protein [Cytophagales bacterium]